MIVGKQLHLVKKEKKWVESEHMGQTKNERVRRLMVQTEQNERNMN